MFKSSVKFLILISIVSNLFAEKAIEGIYYSQNLSGTINYPGLLLSSQVHYRLPLYNKNGLLWESSKIDIGIDNNLSPGFEEPGIFLRCEPIAFFELSVYANRQYFFKYLNCGFIKMDSYSSEYDQDSRKDLSQSNEKGWWIRIIPVLKFAVKNVVVLNALTVHYFRTESDGYFYESYTNTICNDNDKVITNDLLLLYNFNKSFLSGLDYFYQTVPAFGDNVHRISLLGLYSSPINIKTRFNAAIIGGVYLKQRYYDIKNPYLALQLQINYRFFERNRSKI